MAKLDVHHLGLRGPLPSGVPIEAAGALAVGERVLLARGPNLYWASVESEAAEAPRPVNLPGIAHWCMQALDGTAMRAGLAAGGAAFLSPPVALGTGYLYAYGHDANGRLFELETAPFLPPSPPAWFGHVAFVSQDAERLATFYGGLLGAPVTPGGRFRENRRIDQVAGLDGVDLQAWWVRATDFTLEFWRYDAPPAPAGDSTRWYPHLGLQTDELERALDRVAALGGARGAIAAGPDGRSARARDPDGNALLLIELTPHARDRGVASLPHRDAIRQAAQARET